MNRVFGKSLKAGMVGVLTAASLSLAVSCNSSNSSSSEPKPSDPIAEELDLVPTKTTKPKYGSFSCEASKDKKCFTEKYQEPTANTKSVDILFVVQSSASLTPERATIASGIKSFLAALPANSSYNVGVMLAHGSTSNLSGKLYQAGLEPAVLKSSDMTSSDIQAALNSKLTQVVEDPDSGGGEEGMFSLYREITNSALLSESQAAGFFRPSAALAVVFVADRRDICAAPSAGVPAETDPVKIAARIRDCEGLTAQGLTNRLKSLKGSEALAVSGIVYEFPVPAEEGNEVGYGYMDLINLNSGVTIDLGSEDIAAGLSSIGQLSGQQMAQQSVFTLSHTEVDPATVKVTVNGVKATFKLMGQVLTVTQTVPAGALVTITYCVKAVDTSLCTHTHGKGGGRHCEKARHPHGDVDHNDDGHNDQGTK